MRTAYKDTEPPSYQDVLAARSIAKQQKQERRREAQEKRELLQQCQQEQKQAHKSAQQVLHPVLIRRLSQAIAVLKQSVAYAKANSAPLGEASRIHDIGSDLVMSEQWYANCIINEREAHLHHAEALYELLEPIHTEVREDVAIVLDRLWYRLWSYEDKMLRSMQSQVNWSSDRALGEFCLFGMRSREWPTRQWDKLMQLMISKNG